MSKPRTELGYSDLIESQNCLISDLVLHQYRRNKEKYISSARPMLGTGSILKEEQ
jgi:hypothetical protein